MATSSGPISTSNGASTPRPTNSKSLTIIIRKAYLYEYAATGRIAAETYYDTKLIHFIAPHRGVHYSHYERAFVQRSMKRMLDPRNLSIVACEASNPGVPIGYMQLYRYGDDKAAREQIESRASVWLWVLSWVYWAWCKMISVLVGDNSQDPAAAKMLMYWGDRDKKIYWEPYEERKCRWHVQSLVVRKEFQGLGIGKRLLGEVISRAEKEGVVIGLEASGEGEKLYRSVGFELLGRFDQEIIGEENVGGIMLWTLSAIK